MSAIGTSECGAGAAGVRPSAGLGRGALPYLPGLDGIRALAVIAVLLYHASLPWIPGGFLGVEVFFVLSGYLITSLLLSERRQRGGIDLKGFWLRRARRLLPAVFVLLLAVIAYAVVFLPEEVAGMRGDALSAAAYLNNWYQIAAHKSYFEAAGRPSPLRHLWSLAVEEQFYLLWPLLLCGLRRAAPPRVALPVVIAGAAASAAAMAAIYSPDADPSRAYYGTDTRAAGLLAGAALAFARPPGRAGQAASGRAIDAAGLAALGVLAACSLCLNEFEPFLYRGGFALVALATAALIAACVDPRARIVPRLLSFAPLRWIGTRSYGIYLWHFPVLMVTRPQLDLPFDGAPLLAGRIALTLAIAALSYRFVERPIRQGALGRAWREWQQARGADKRLWTLRWGASALSLAFVASLLVASLFNARPAAAPEFLRAAAAAPVAPAVPAVSAAAENPPADAERETTPWPATTLPGNAVAAAPADPPAAPASGVSITAIGDSVLLGVADELRRVLGTNVVVDAALGRQAARTPEVVRSLRAAGKLGPTVILHVGSNGAFRERVFDRIMAEMPDARRIVVVNVRVPRAWEAPNNAMLAAAVARRPDAVLVDWNAASAGRPELFWRDGIHLRPAGARFYAGLIAQAVRAPAPADAGLALADAGARRRADGAGP